MSRKCSKRQTVIQRRISNVHITVLSEISTFEKFLYLLYMTISLVDLRLICYKTSLSSTNPYEKSSLIYFEKKMNFSLLLGMTEVVFG